MNTGDPCPICAEGTWAYNSTTLTCKKGHRTSLDAPAPVALRVVARRNIPAAAWALAGAIAVFAVDHLT